MLLRTTSSWVRTKATAAALAVGLLLLLTVATVADDWHGGRATWYDDRESMTVDYGSCGYGYIDANRFPGYHVAALSDSYYKYQNSCG